MRVLVACEYSGRVRNAFAALGHDVMSADFEPAEDESPYHYQGNCFDLINDQQFDLMIAHPPCTYLAASGMHWTTRGFRDPRLTEDALDFVQRLLNAPIPMIALENPIGAISKRIRKPDQIIHPYMFGDDASKSTCLWLKGLPLLTPTAYVEPRIVNGKNDGRIKLPLDRIKRHHRRPGGKKEAAPIGALLMQWLNNGVTT